MVGLGVPAGEELYEAGEERPVLLRVEALDLRSPWADEGRPGGLIVPEAPNPAGCGEGDQGFPASSASNYHPCQYKEDLVIACPTHTPFRGTGLQPSSGTCHERSCLLRNHRYHTAS